MEMLGLAEEEILSNRHGESEDETTQAALTFVATLVEKHGQVSESEVDQVRLAGFDDGQIAELVGTTVHTILTNYFNLTAGTPIDFPKVKALTVV